MKIIKRISKKTNTVGGEKCKIIVTVCIDKQDKIFVSIKKFVLTERYEAIKELGFVLNRTFKDKVLLSQEMTFTGETFSQIVTMLYHGKPIH